MPPPFMKGGLEDFRIRKLGGVDERHKTRIQGGLISLGASIFFAGGALLFQIIEIHTFLKQIMIFVDKYYFLCLMINTYNIQYHMIFC